MKIHHLFEDPQYDEVRKIVDTHCRKNFTMMLNGAAPMLWRGLENWPSDRLHTAGIMKYSILPKRETPRESKAFSPIVMRWLDTHPAWSAFPKRSFSQMATTNPKHAKSFGNLYIVVPFDNAGPYGYAKKDINLSDVGAFNVMRLGQDFSRTYRYLARLNMRLENARAKKLNDAGAVLKLQQAISRSLVAVGVSQGLTPRFTELTTIDRIKSACDLTDVAIAQIIKTVKSTKDVEVLNACEDALLDLSGANTFNGQCLVYDKPIFNQLDAALSPKNLKAHVTTSTPGIKPDSEEVWFNGSCLMISSAKFDPDFSSEAKYMLANLMTGGADLIPKRPKVAGAKPIKTASSKSE